MCQSLIQRISVYGLLLVMLFDGMPLPYASAQSRSSTGTVKKTSPAALHLHDTNAGTEPVKFTTYAGNPPWHELKAVLIAGGENRGENGSLYPRFEKDLQ